jgi:hypothetical protein
MILLEQDMVWVRGADGCLTPFAVRRLASAIYEAARQAGSPADWIAVPVAEAVAAYLTAREGDRVVAASELRQIVLAVLEMLGCGEIARVYQHGRQRVEIRLDELAARSGAGFELDFFQQLDAALAAVRDDAMRQMRVQGLRACVLQLRGAQRWGTECRRMAEEIVGHVRGRVARMRSRTAESLNLAVLE